jgi:hypothetical protein
VGNLVFCRKNLSVVKVIMAHVMQIRNLENVYHSNLAIIAASPPKIIIT